VLPRGSTVSSVGDVALHASDAIMLMYTAHTTTTRLRDLTTSSRATNSNVSWLKDFLENHGEDLPDMEDLQGAADSMLRLQRTYVPFQRT
jgi:hypothetical protein